jgi:hypothetical protein
MKFNVNQKLTKRVLDYVVSNQIKVTLYNHCYKEAFSAVIVSFDRRHIKTDNGGLFHRDELVITEMES